MVTAGAGGPVFGGRRGMGVACLLRRAIRLPPTLVLRPTLRSLFIKTYLRPYVLAVVAGTSPTRQPFPLRGLQTLTLEETVFP